MSVLIWASYVSMLILGLMDNMRGPFFPEVLADYMIGVEKGSFFFAVASALSFCGSLFGHRFLQRWSAQALLMWASVGFSIGFAAIALSSTFAMLMVACAFFGLSFGGLNLAQNMVVSEEAPAHSRRRIFNGLHSMYGLSALIAPILASVFRWLGMDWRQAFLTLSIFPLIWTLVAYFKLAKPKHHSTRAPVANLSSSEWTIVILYAIFIAAYLWGEISLSTRMVQWLRGDLRMAPDPANLYMGAFFALFLSGRLLFSLVHFKNLGNWDILRYSSLAAAVFMFLGIKYHPAFLPLSGLMMAPFYPTAMEQVNFRFNEKRSQALGFIIGFGSLSVVAMHLVLGWVGAVRGLTDSLLICAAGLAAVFLALQVRTLFDTSR